MKLSIRDRAFGHALFSNNPMPPVSFARSIKWDRASPESDKTIYTDAEIRNASEASHAWLLEPWDNQPDIYDIASRTNFLSIWTHDRVLMDLNRNARFVPFGGCWIDPLERRVWTKRKDVSIIASHKDGTHGQRMRHQVARLPGVEAHGGPYSVLEHKIEGLRDYRFSIAIENHRRDFFFSEKLIDCFATGTVPIYWGCPGIGNFFNLDGMVIVDSADAIRGVLPELDADLYSSMLPAILDNFERAKDYYLTEDWLCEKSSGLLEGLAL